MNSFFTHLSSILIIILPYLVSSQTCQNTCGQVPIKYPFGTGAGCGEPRYTPYVTCTGEQLTFTTHTGCYTITTIDYSNQVMYISDPTMSTCSCTQPSKGFGLDWDAPFSFHDSTVFALLGCSTTSSPIYSVSEDGGSNGNTTFPMCDSEGGSVCSLLYSCEAIGRLSLPITTCCVYTPVDLGPSFEMDLQKLQCTSYSALYGFNGQESNPAGWKYGIAIKYKFNYNNDYPTLCATCEKSGGVCGYKSSPDKAFTCNCPDGLNRTMDCFYGGTWSHGSRSIPWKAEALSLIGFSWFIMLVFV
ncbi:wall-associated receptor kinase 3 [Salvia hispanica]|uniref:wall-associated receptor kinase 3 n=1 Tax=Salvia hispanica TaxID=49212 RepID=UPI002009DB50|nr:wall-associated receptor kinase 3 [Salvia hispanica]